MTPEPRLPETPLEAIDGTMRERVFLDGLTVLLDRPANADRLVDHPAVKEALLSREVMPYWADLWPAARMLAKWLLRREFVPGTRALEIGCGLGLSGIVGLSRGLHVTFSDHDATALRFAARNARLNGFAQFDTLQMDWNAPPPDLAFPIILAADLTYETKNIAPLVALVKQALAPDGVCYLTDQDRIPAALLRQMLEQAGMPFTMEVLRAGEPGGRRLKGTLYTIRRSVGSR